MHGPRIADAFGETVLAHHHGQRTFAVMERDDGFVSAHDPAQYFTGPDEWNPAELEACARLTGKVLDVGCGAGRHLLYLQRQGLDCGGIDPSAGACEVSRSRGVRQVWQLGLADLVRDEVGERFDSFLMLGANLALLGSAERAPAVLAALASVAAPRARIVGVGGFGASPDPAQLAYHQRNRAAGRLAGTVRVRTRFRDLADPWIELLFCTADELADVVAGTSWELARVDPHGDSYLAELALRSLV